MNDINEKETLDQRRERKAREYREYLEKNREKEIQRKRDYRARKKAEKEGQALTAAQLRPMVDDAKKAAQQAYRDLQSAAHRFARNSTMNAPYQARYKMEWDRGFPALQAARLKRDQLLAAWKAAVTREKEARRNEKQLS